LLGAIKELCLLVRTRLEDAVVRGEVVDRPSLEALIVLQRSVEEAETGPHAVPAAVMRAASDLLLETELFAPEGQLLERLRTEIDRAELATPPVPSRFRREPS
jgi:hypothetical protein